ncbi:MAG: formylglycine-generating enzyme family protein [Treponema sp.]|nr:formylglycine-generating enzyme family protein [Treponema sp.]
MKTRMFPALLAAVFAAVSLMACINGSDDDEDSESMSYRVKGSSTGSSSSVTGSSGTGSDGGIGSGSGPTPRTVTTVFVGMNVGTSVTFSMGCDQTGRGRDCDKEMPAHSVTLTRNFSICDHEVTQAEYTAVMGVNPSKYTGDETLPVEKVSWYDALVYCNRRSMTEGLTPCYTISGSTDPADWGPVPASSSAAWNGVACDFDANGYRLPTEAEWEYAARAGNTATDSMVWSGTTVESLLGDYTWYSGNSTSNGSRTTHPVKSKQPNAKGLYDMSGNVEEWCWDRYDSNYYSICNLAGDVENPVGASSGSGHIVRGGSIQRGVNLCSVSFRTSYVPEKHIAVVGFRVCRTAE